MAQAAQRRGAICGALAIACAGLLVLWADARDPPATRPVVQSDRADEAVRPFTAAQTSMTRSSLSTSHVDGDPPTDETRVGNRDALPALIVALGDADPNVRVDAVADLGLIHDTQVESLLAITAMQDPAPAVRVEALYALGSLRAESQLAAFRHALDDPDKDVRKAAISALEELEDDASTELLTVALNDHDAAIAAAAAEALAYAHPAHPTGSRAASHPRRRSVRTAK